LSEFWKKIKSLFQESEQSSPSQPVIHQIIERSEADKIAFEKWKATLSSKRIIDWLYNQYAAFLSPNTKTDNAVAFLNTPSTKGFVVHFHQINRPQWVESIQRHYLKPSLNFKKKETEKFNQGYGNIKIELEFRNEKVFNLRFSATTYQDHNFNKADEFKELMGILLR